MTTKPLKRRPKKARCRGCRQLIKVKARGRVPIYCSQTCKQEAYLKRRYHGPMELLQQDLATARVREAIRREVMSCLAQLGLVSPGTPPPRPKAKAPPLRIISSDLSAP